MLTDDDDRVQCVSIDCKLLISWIPYRCTLNGYIWHKLIYVEAYLNLSSLSSQLISVCVCIWYIFLEKRLKEPCLYKAQHWGYQFYKKNTTNQNAHSTELLTLSQQQPRPIDGRTRR